MEAIQISDDFIKLGQALKLANLVSSGVEAKIVVQNGEVKVNGKVIDEPYINAPTNNPGDFDKPIRIPEGYVFVMGDNRNESLDSRFSTIGVIDERYILGVVNARLFPFGDWEI